MTQLTALDWFLVGGLMIAFVALLLTDRHTRLRDKEVIDIVRRIDALLRTWASKWGCGPEEMREALTEAIRQHDLKHGRRKGDQ